MPKAAIPVSPSSRLVRRHNPLSDDLVATAPIRQNSGKRKSREYNKENEENFADSRASRNILRIGNALAEEAEAETRENAPNPAFTFESRFDANDEDDGAEYMEDNEAWGDEEEIFIEEADLDPSDLNLFNKFLPAEADKIFHESHEDNSVDQGTNLTELILAKIAAYEDAQERGENVQSGGPVDESFELPAKVVEIYTQVGFILSRYKSGKIPKPFKIIPKLENWEELLTITNPDSWTPNACYEATKLFISGKPHIAQIFLEMVILPRVVEDIRETKKLSVHLYNALKKALYKPAAFFKGFLFPLVSSDMCTLREAHIVSSVLARVTIPVLHSAAALLRLCDIAAEQASVSTESGGATNIFIRVLLEKKYALPYKVVDALVFHFLRFRMSVEQAEGNSQGEKNHKLPVLWHQSLLAFSQRYKNDITEDQREMLLDLLQKRGHKDIGPEVRRELLEGRGRGIVAPESNELIDGDDTMMIDTS